MFSQAKSFNPQGDKNINTKVIKYIDLEGNEHDYKSWDTKHVTNMSYMFNRAENFGDISRWNTSQVTDMVICF